MKTLLHLLISVIWASVIVLEVDRCGQTLDISESRQALLIVSETESPETDQTLWKFTVHVLLKPGLENFEHYFTSV